MRLRLRALPSRRHSGQRPAARPSRLRPGVIAAILAATALFTMLTAPIARAADPASIVFRGTADRKWIALTFDDNTIQGPTLATLQVLREYQVPATLFVVGTAIHAFPDVTQAMAQGVADGLFEVADHSLSHADLTTLSAEALRDQIGGGTDAFAQVTGAPTVPYFRPPYGHNNSLVAQIGGERGFTHLVLWDAGTEDWTGEPAQTIEDNMVARAHNGSIMLLHMGAPNTAAALPGIITRLRAAGYQFVLVSTMLTERPLFVDVDPAGEVGAAVATLVADGYMSGYDTARFGPRDPFTRRQAAKVVSLVGNIHTEEIDNPETRTFWDVAPAYTPLGTIEPYPYDFVEEAVATGLVQGSVDGEGRQVFRPDAHITRTQLAQVLARMVRQLKGFPERLDGPSRAYGDVPGYAAADVDLVAKLNLMTGYADGRFGAYDNAQRGHVAMVMARYLRLADY